ncbi:MAG: hypothetical protein ACE5I7_02850 [Candidatus Binatia bacterium]
MAGERIVLAGYVIRCPLGGYAWQVLHYLAGLRALGFDPWFYEDTAHYGDCFDPATGNRHATPESGLAFAADFFGRFGFGDRWVFWDAVRNRYHGLASGDAAALLREARLVITLGPVNRLARSAGQRKVFIDLDPAFTQIRAAQGEPALCQLLAEHDLHFTIGENVGSAACPIPTKPFHWRPTRQPIALELWRPLPRAAAAAFTTIGRWDEQRREIHFRGESYSWRKRLQWMSFLDLPARTGERFALAMDIDRTPADGALLRQHGWKILDPIAVSSGATRYREFIRSSRGEFTVAKDLNVRLASGWFSDRSACYLAAGRPVITEDTGFHRVLPTGAGLFAVRTLDDAITACRTIAADYDAHTHAARQIAEEYFAAARVLRDLIARV